jgi:hypothetical protein
MGRGALRERKKLPPGEDSVSEFGEPERFAAGGAAANCGAARINGVWPCRPPRLIRCLILVTVLSPGMFCCLRVERPTRQTGSTDAQVLTCD